MQLRAFGFSFVLLATGLSPAASVTTPVVSLPVLRSDFVLDPSMTSGNPGAQSSQTQSIGPDGSTITEVHGSYVASGSHTTSVQAGGGTLNWTTNESFDGTLVQSISTTANSWSYQSTFDFRNSLEYTASATTSGNFFFILLPSSENTLSFDRYAQILVDQPIALRLSLSAAFTQGYFSSVTGSTVLLADPFNFQGLMLTTSFGNLTGSTDPTLFQKAGTKGAINYLVNASGNRNGVEYEILLTPQSPGISEYLELRWFIDYESALQGFGSNKLVTDLEVSGTLRESLIVTAIPEPTPVLLFSLAALPAMGYRRRHPPAKSTPSAQVPPISPGENRELPG